MLQSGNGPHWPLASPPAAMIALKGYEGAATTDPRQQAEAVSFFIADHANPPQ